MATKPTVGGSDGTWGTELNAHLEVSIAADGKIKDGATQTTSAAPTANAELANKKYVDDQITASGFQDRGDPASADFAVGDLTTDGTWNDMDLSSIVASGARIVLLRVEVLDGSANSLVRFREKGNSNEINTARIQTIVANVSTYGDIIVKLDSNRVIEYKGTNLTFTNLYVTVAGWWI